MLNNVWDSRIWMILCCNIDISGYHRKLLARHVFVVDSDVSNLFELSLWRILFGKHLFALNWTEKALTTVMGTICIFLHFPVNINRWTGSPSKCCCLFYQGEQSLFEINRIVWVTGISKIWKYIFSASTWKIICWALRCCAEEINSEMTSISDICAEDEDLKSSRRK